MKFVRIGDLCNSSSTYVPLLFRVGGPPIHRFLTAYLQLQKRATDQSWLPPSPAIRMWRQNDDGTPNLPLGVPPPVPLRPLWGNVVVDPTKKNQEKELIRAGDCLTKQSFIQQGIAKYIELWKSMMARDAMYAKDMAGYVHYWERIYSEITGPVPPTPAELQEGFWPITNWQRDHARSGAFGGLPDVPPDTTPEDDPEPFPYCGPAKARPKPSFNPYRDVLLGDFVLCRPCDGQSTNQLIITNQYSGVQQ